MASVVQVCFRVHCCLILLTVVFTNTHMHTHTHTHTHTNKQTNKQSRFSTENELDSRSALVNVSHNHDLVSYTFANLNGGMYEVTVSSISKLDGQCVKGQSSQLVTFVVGKLKTSTYRCRLLFYW